MVEAPTAADLSAAAQVPGLPLQVDLLQLPPEVPAPGAPALRGVLDRLFAHWLSLPDTATLLASLVHKAKSTTGGGGGGGAAASMLPSMMLQGGAAVPPLSPRSPRLSRRPSSLGAGQPNRSASPLRPPAARPAKEVIPQVRYPSIGSDLDSRFGPVCTESYLMIAMGVLAIGFLLFCLPVLFSRWTATAVRGEEAMHIDS